MRAQTAHEVHATVHERQRCAPTLRDAANFVTLGRCARDQHRAAVRDGCQAIVHTITSARKLIPILGEFRQGRRKQPRP